MQHRIRRFAEHCYERVLRAELSETPSHVAVIQDGNRRYASEHGQDPTDGHRAGAETTEQLLRWCDDLGIEEVTLYAFSTENFARPPEEREALFDLAAEKLRQFADSERIQEAGIRIRAIGETDQLPERVREAIGYAERRTADNSTYHLNVALAYGGRRELLAATRTIADRVERGDLDPAAVDVDTVEAALYEGPEQDVDLIVRSGGDERTSNFLPWQANGNEAAVYFSAPHWPAFRKIDFLRGIRTYEGRKQARRRSRLGRARTVVSAVAATVADATPLRRLGSLFRGTDSEASTETGDDPDASTAD